MAARTELDHFKYKLVAVTVEDTETVGVSAADTDLVGGAILSITPAGNQDQLIDNVELETDGVVTVTLAAAATLDNVFNVMVQQEV